MLHHPFTREEWTYATNGRIIIRVPRVEGVATVPVQAEAVFTEISSQEVAIPESIPDPTISECPKCRGTGVIVCLTCESECSCKKCQGAGRLTEDPPVLIGNQRLRADHLRLISRLPGVKLLLNIQPGENCAFTFEGGEGRMSPVSA